MPGHTVMLRRKLEDKKPPGLVFGIWFFAMEEDRLYLLEIARLWWTQFAICVSPRIDHSLLKVLIIEIEFLGFCRGWHGSDSRILYHSTVNNNKARKPDSLHFVCQTNMDHRWWYDRARRYQIVGTAETVSFCDLYRKPIIVSDPYRAPLVGLFLLSKVFWIASCKGNVILSCFEEPGLYRISICGNDWSR